MRFLIIIARTYPLHSITMVLALLLAGVLEGVGLSMLLPILGMAVGQQPGSGQLSTESMGATGSTLEQLVADSFSALGISPTVGVLLLIFITTISVKSALVLLAKKTGRLYCRTCRHRLEA